MQGHGLGAGNTEQPRQTRSSRRQMTSSEKKIVEMNVYDWKEQGKEYSA